MQSYPILSLSKIITQSTLIGSSIFIIYFLNSIGPYGCVGKQLALLNMRTLIARLVQTFDIRFAPGETGEGLLAATRDVFTLDLAPLELVFERLVVVGG
jgi:hypothetical protein